MGFRLMFISGFFLVMFVSGGFDCCLLVGFLLLFISGFFITVY